MFFVVSSHIHPVSPFILLLGMKYPISIRDKKVRFKIQLFSCSVSSVGFWTLVYHSKRSAVQVIRATRCITTASSAEYQWVQYHNDEGLLHRRAPSILVFMLTLYLTQQTLALVPHLVQATVLTHGKQKTEENVSLSQLLLSSQY